jgi:hypothetical protein
MTNTQILLKDIIQQEFKENPNGYNSLEDFFEFFSTKELLKRRMLSDEEILQGIKGNGNDGGCDSIYIFCNGHLVKEDFLERKDVPEESTIEMLIIQSKTAMSFNEDVIMKWKTISDNLFDFNKNINDYSARYNEDVRDSFQLFRDVYKTFVRNRVKLAIKYYYLSEGDTLHPNVKQQGEELEKLVKKHFPVAKVTVEYYGAEKIMECFSSSISGDYELQLVDNPISLGNNKDYVALVSLREYYKFITNDGEILDQTIFEANIRDYQGDVIVNKGIQKSLLNDFEKTDFWWLNNGITILAENVVPVTSRTLLITEPEIVNGLQTSNEIYNYFSENSERLSTDTRSLLVRIIVPNNDQLRDEIIFATNNQTTIPKSSLRVSDPIHRQIEIYFEKEGLFYDRRKNYYKNHGKKSSEIISVSYLAQSLIAVLLQKPNYSRARPSTLLTDDEYYDALYKREIELSVYYKIVIWANEIKRYLRQCGLYDIKQQGDLLFYVLYYSCAKKVNNSIITDKDVKEMEQNFLTTKDIEEYCKHIYDIYMSLGGTGKVAKGSGMIDILKSEFS